MNYVLTGAAGKITKPLAERLLQAGKSVKVIGRNDDHLRELHEAGASIAIGSVEDLKFLEVAFNGADAVYTMYPPDIGSNDMKSFYEKLGKNYAEAIQTNEVKYVVNLSSIGAHLSQGAGHISTLYYAEQALNHLHQVNIKHLRPAFFYTNLFAQIDLIKHMGTMGGNFSISENKFPVVHPHDIAEVAAEELLGLNFSGHTIRYIASDETGTDKIAAAIGKAIGKPDLKWLQFTDEQTLEGLLQAGFTEAMANLFVEGFRALHTGTVREDYWRNRPTQLGAIKLEDFADAFAAVYNSYTVMHA